MLLYFPRLKVFHKRYLPKSLNQNENDSLKFYQPNESEATTFDNKSEQDVVLNISSHSSGSIPLFSPTSEQSVMFSDKLSQDMAFVECYRILILTSHSFHHKWPSFLNAPLLLSCLKRKTIKWKDLLQAVSLSILGIFLSFYPILLQIFPQLIVSWS